MVNCMSSGPPQGVNLSTGNCLLANRQLLVRKLNSTGDEGNTTLSLL